MTEPVVLKPPGLWLPRLAMFLGVVCLGLSIWSWVELAEVRFERSAVRTILDDASRHTETSGNTHAALMSAYRDLGLKSATWSKRRIGFIIAGLILLVGGFIGTGLVRLHEKMTWAEVDE